tara:strand:+ start:41 stop:460 length:420 start_codon:yes stop_codon:yes gene_type:complete
MAHYAIVDSDNIVLDVIVGRNETDTPPTGFSNWEEYYTDFMGNTALRCSYNTAAGTHTDGGTPFRGNFPGPGDKYFVDLDIFAVATGPYPSWTLDSNGVYQPPVAMPLDGKPYIWDEDNTQWVRDPDISDDDIVVLPEQ